MFTLTTYNNLCTSTWMMLKPTKRDNSRSNRTAKMYLGRGGVPLNKSAYFQPRKVLFGGGGGGRSLFSHKGPGGVIDPRALKDTVQPNYPTFQFIPAPTPTPSPSIKRLSEKAPHKRGGICLQGNGMEMIYNHPIRAPNSRIILFGALHFDHLNVHQSDQAPQTTTTKIT